jgi:hypothetical protein
MLSPAEIAWFGQVGSQLPQLMQVSVITIAMVESPFRASDCHAASRRK